MYSILNKELAYHESLSLIKKAATSVGFVASINQMANYRRVWSRDGIITGLAGLLSDDEKLIFTLKQTIKTLWSHQHASGFLPSNVVPETHAVSYGGSVGRADNPTWAIIGLCQYSLITNDFSLATQYKNQVLKALFALDVWEYNGKNLVYVPQSGDWADEYYQHGYLLYDQLLRVWALESAAKTYDLPDLNLKAKSIRETIEANFWYRSDDENWYAAHLKRTMQTDEAKKLPYWIAGFNPSATYYQFDLQANAFALLLNIGDSQKQHQITGFLKEQFIFKQQMVPSFYPAIEDDDHEMVDLKMNFAYEFRNLPHEFHNGGLWPVWNGWLGAALVEKKENDSAENLLNLINTANEKENWGFYENFHGKTHEPIGVKECVWSASGAVILHQYLSGKKLIF